MYNGKPCIAMIFDRSWLVYDIQVGQNIVGNILFRYKDKAEYVYGGIPRLCYHVEEFKRGLKLPDEIFHKLCIPYKDGKFITKAVMSDWVLETLNYKPDQLHILRDNGHTNETSTLVQYAIRNRIPVIEYDNRGHVHTLGYGTSYSTKEWLELNKYIGRKYHDV